jgi:ABC-type sugar transport system ATPase subunit
MGRAIVRSPKVFLFDEPLSNLDGALRAELRTEIAALLRRLGVTAIYVTHDHVEAMTMADRIAVLCTGALQQVGPPREIYEDPANAFVAGFLGAPPINWIAVELREGRWEGAGALFAPPLGNDLPAQMTAAIRPESFHLADAGTPDASQVAIPATVTAIEPLGAETHVLLDAHGTKLRAKVSGFDAPRRGSAVWLRARASAVLWFDRGTGARIRPSGPPGPS